MLCCRIILPLYVAMKNNIKNIQRSFSKYIKYMNAFETDFSGQNRYYTVDEMRQPNN